WSPAAPQLSELRRDKDIENFTTLKMVLELGLYGAATAALGGLSVRSSRLAGKALLVGMAVLVLITFVDGVLGAPLYQAIRKASDDPVTPAVAMVKVSMGGYPLVLLFWPCARLLDAWKFPGRNILIASLAVLTLVSMHITGADAPVLALVLGGLAWLGVRTLGKPFVRALIPIVSAIFIFAPMAVLWGVRSGLFAWLHVLVPPSWDMRLNIWAFAANQVVVHALRGWGIDASRKFGPAIPLHTHNAALQLWLELGSLGAALGAAFFAWILYRIVGWTGNDRRDGAMATGSLVAYLVIGSLSFGVWQEWWLGLGAIAVIACGIAQKSSAVTR
ncbi:MAG TPA: O-antigen ligase family protein, partial [Caulobacter sp.]|nr:O-antigen ligase family protein [Caulobacter sp.]